MSNVKQTKKGTGIKVVYKGQTWYLGMNQGVLSFNALKKCFPTATSLYYLRDTGEEIVNEILTVENDNLNIVDTTPMYYPYIPQGTVDIP